MFLQCVSFNFVSFSTEDTVIFLRSFPRCAATDDLQDAWNSQILNDFWQQDTQINNSGVDHSIIDNNRSCMSERPLSGEHRGVMVRGRSPRTFTPRCLTRNGRSRMQTLYLLPSFNVNVVLNFCVERSLKCLRRKMLDPCY